MGFPFFIHQFFWTVEIPILGVSVLHIKQNVYGILVCINIHCFIIAFMFDIH